MPQLAIIADDMTGAADAGAAFARAGLTVILALSGQPLPPSDVLIISTESRHLPPQQARASVQHATHRAAAAHWIYKKIDSTLRGNPGVELSTLLDELGVARALIAPAFPAQGRTTLGGRQLVDGVALGRTTFAAAAPVSDLCAIFAGRRGQACTLIGLETVRRGIDALCAAVDMPGLYVADATTDADLDALAQAAVRCDVRVCCGSAGLTGALAARLPLRGTAARPIVQTRGGPILAVAGSRHETTLRQVQAAERAGASIVLPGERFMNNRAAFAAIVEEVEQHLTRGRHTILSSAAMPGVPLGEAAVARRLAEATCEIARRCAVGGLVLTGGDIAGAVFRTLEGGALWLRGEVEPGVPWGTLVGGTLSGAGVVTKAGGFGGETTIAAAIDWLSSMASARPASTG